MLYFVMFKLKIILVLIGFDSNNSTSYVKLKDIVKEYRPQVIQKQNIGKVLPRVHIAISNAKRMLLDIYHNNKPEYLKNYLNEFCYKFKIIEFLVFRISCTFYLLML